jgi:hypothetical protein
MILTTVSFLLLLNWWGVFLAPDPPRSWRWGDICVKIQAPLRVFDSIPLLAPVGCLTVFDCDFNDPDSMHWQYLGLWYIVGPVLPDSTWHVDCHGCAREHVRDP